MVNAEIASYQLVQVSGLSNPNVGAIVALRLVNNPDMVFVYFTTQVPLPPNKELVGYHQLYFSLPSFATTMEILREEKPVRVSIVNNGAGGIGTLEELPGEDEGP
jgi:hypothetical protein